MRTPDGGAHGREAGSGEQASSPLGRFTNLVELDRVDSTNRFALDAAREGAAEGLVVLAHGQDAGRGRRGRSWSAPQGGGLLCSVLFRPRLAPDELHLVPSAVALAARAALGVLGARDVAIKWPNDLVAGGGKLGGILTELVGTEASRVLAVVVGLGVNLAFPEGFEPAGLHRGALAPVTLEQLTGVRRAARELLDPMLGELEARYGGLAGPSGRRALAEEYRGALATIGEQVLVETADGEIRGLATGIDRAGRLLVRGEQGEVAVTVGDVVHLRRSPSTH